MSDPIDAIRAFNRFFTLHAGAIDARCLPTDLNLAQARLLFEIGRSEPVTASALQDTLRLDRGYLSRMIAHLEDRGWIARAQVASDARAGPISLTPEGRAAGAALDARQRAAVAQDLARLGPPERDDLVRALTQARLLLAPEGGGACAIRPARAGEPALIAARQSAMYAQSHGWGRPLEALVTQSVATFLRDFKPDTEQAWVAEIDGVMAGAVFLTDEGEGVARLRLLHVEPFARRRGIGDALVARCIEFARACGHARIMLWTHTVLEAARRLYARHGFVHVATAMHHAFGEPVQGETWCLTLAKPGAGPGAEPCAKPGAVALPG